MMVLLDDGEVIGDGGASGGMSGGELHVVSVEREHIEVGHGGKVHIGGWLGQPGQEVVVEEWDGDGAAVVAGLPLRKAVVVVVGSMRNPPQVEHFALKHEVDVAVVGRVGLAVNLDGVEVPQAKPVAYVAIVVGAAAQRCECDDCQDNMLC